MRFHQRCGPGGRLEFDIPDGLFAMGRGPRAKWGPFEWDFGDGSAGRHGGGHGRGGRGRRRMFEGGELRLVLLKLIANEPRHGYDLIRAIEEMTGGEYAPSPGVVYPTLTLLQDMGLIEEAPGEGARKSFQATADGREHLAEHEDEVDALLERLGELKPSPHPNGPSPVWRAMRNLGVAIRNRLGHGDVTDETVHELAALIDEFAQRVERLK
jgi:DNA-binding PadR family transcriptional regulator